MTTGGWINMILSVGFVTVLFVYCTYRILTGPPSSPDHRRAHIEPLDEDEAQDR
jgi:hypothetical protein